MHPNIPCKIKFLLLIYLIAVIITHIETLIRHIIITLHDFLTYFNHKYISSVVNDKSNKTPNSRRIRESWVVLILCLLKSTFHFILYRK
jgi:hypothetical protein